MIIDEHFTCFIYTIIYIRIKKTTQISVIWKEGDTVLLLYSRRRKGESSLTPY